MPCAGSHPVDVNVHAVPDDWDGDDAERGGG